MRTCSSEQDLGVWTQIRLCVGARTERRVRWARSTTVRHSQTVGKRSSTTLAWAWRNGNDTIRTLGARIATGEDRLGEWELEVLHASLTCYALFNGVESGHHIRIGGSITTTAILAGIDPTTSRS